MCFIFIFLTRIMSSSVHANETKLSVVDVREAIQQQQFLYLLIKQKGRTRREINEPKGIKREERATLSKPIRKRAVVRTTVSVTEACLFPMTPLHAPPPTTKEKQNQFPLHMKPVSPYPLHPLSSLSSISNLTPSQDDPPVPAHILQRIRTECAADAHLFPAVVSHLVNLLSPLALCEFVLELGLENWQTCFGETKRMELESTGKQVESTAGPTTATSSVSLLDYPLRSRTCSRRLCRTFRHWQSLPHSKRQCSPQMATCFILIALLKRITNLLTCKSDQNSTDGFGATSTSSAPQTQTHVVAFPPSSVEEGRWSNRSCTLFFLTDLIVRIVTTPAETHVRLFLASFEETATSDDSDYPSVDSSLEYARECAIKLLQKIQLKCHSLGNIHHSLCAAFEHIRLTTTL